MFAAFGKEKLDRINSTILPLKIAKWKYKEKELLTIHYAYILAICDILLNPKSSSIKCNDKDHNEIAVAEKKETDEEKKNKQGSQESQKEKFSEAGGSDDYNKFMNDLDSQFF
ncbi:hypothetical protein RhiirA4_465768 [Rhizophagus irregularis]|uniref:Uncharacterized protein n=1 Tax=Rhizophagus irregularis TaxID=588596 RepID=A0A2I1GSV4_9GLOM|nr:hypothetical protein RhiirA4_465768 [Rhizophagus irregularis]